MAQQSRVLMAFAEDLDLVPSSHMAAHNHLTPVPGDLMPSSELLGNMHSMCAHVHAHKYNRRTRAHTQTHTYTHVHAHTHIKAHAHRHAGTHLKQKRRNLTTL